MPWRVIGHDGTRLEQYDTLADTGNAHHADVTLDCLSGIVSLERAGRSVGFVEQEHAT